MPDKPKSRLTLYIAVAIVLAILLAVFAPGFAMQFELGGEIQSIGAEDSTDGRRSVGKERLKLTHQAHRGMPFKGVQV